MGCDFFGIRRKVCIEEDEGENTPKTVDIEEGMPVVLLGCIFVPDVLKFLGDLVIEHMKHGRGED